MQPTIPLSPVQYQLLQTFTATKEAGPAGYVILNPAKARDHLIIKITSKIIHIFNKHQRRVERVLRLVEDITLVVTCGSTGSILVGCTSGKAYRVPLNNHAENHCPQNGRSLGNQQQSKPLSQDSTSPSATPSRKRRGRPPKKMRKTLTGTQLDSPVLELSQSQPKEAPECSLFEDPISLTTPGSNPHAGLCMMHLAPQSQYYLLCHRGLQNMISINSGKILATGIIELAQVHTVESDKIVTNTIEGIDGGKPVCSVLLRAEEMEHKLKLILFDNSQMISAVVIADSLGAIRALLCFDDDGGGRYKTKMLKDYVSDDIVTCCIVQDEGNGASNAVDVLVVCASGMIFSLGSRGFITGTGDSITPIPHKLQAPIQHALVHKGMLCYLSRGKIFVCDLGYHILDASRGMPSYAPDPPGLEIQQPSLVNAFDCFLLGSCEGSSQSPALQFFVLTVAGDVCSFLLGVETLKQEFQAHASRTTVNSGNSHQGSSEIKTALEQLSFHWNQRQQLQGRARALAAGLGARRAALAAARALRSSFPPPPPAEGTGGGGGGGVSSAHPARRRWALPEEDDGGAAPAAAAPPPLRFRCQIDPGESTSIGHGLRLHFNLSQNHAIGSSFIDLKGWHLIIQLATNDSMDTQGERTSLLSFPLSNGLGITGTFTAQHEVQLPSQAPLFLAARLARPPSPGGGGGGGGGLSVALGPPRRADVLAWAAPAPPPPFSSAAPLPSGAGGGGGGGAAAAAAHHRQGPAQQGLRMVDTGPETAVQRILQKHNHKQGDQDAALAQGSTVHSCSFRVHFSSLCQGPAPSLPSASAASDSAARAPVTYLERLLGPADQTGLTWSEDKLCVSGISYGSSFSITAHVLPRPHQDRQDRGRNAASPLAAPGCALLIQISASSNVMMLRLREALQFRLKHLAGLATAAAAAAAAAAPAAAAALAGGVAGDLAAAHDRLRGLGLELDSLLFEYQDIVKEQKEYADIGVPKPMSIQKRTETLNDKIWSKTMSLLSAVERIPMNMP